MPQAQDYILTEDQIEMIHLTAEIVAAFVSNNSVQRDDLSQLISATFAALQATGEPVQVVVEKPVPPVSIKKSITPDYLISLEDGKRYQSLKRHLTTHGLTPRQYRDKWELPPDFPMVAANYSTRRSELAKSIGLGLQRRKSVAERAVPDPAPAKSAKARKPRVSKPAV